MRARWLLALIASLALGFTLAACDSDSEGGSQASTEEAPEGIPGAPALDSPPATTASAAGRTVEMGIGTYCWARVCVDKIGPITKETLAVNRRDRVVVAVPPGTPPLREVSVTAFLAGQSQKLDNGDTAWQPDFAKSIELPTAELGQRVEFVADLQPGSYVVNVGMRFEPGDVQYSVVLNVK